MSGQGRLQAERVSTEAIFDAVDSVELFRKAVAEGRAGEDEAREVREQVIVALDTVTRMCPDPSIPGLPEAMSGIRVAAEAVYTHVVQKRDRDAALAAADQLIRLRELRSAAFKPVLEPPPAPIPVPEREATGPARWLALRVVRVVPVAHRGRYAEEFAAELADLADAPRRQQVIYAIRLAVRAWHLRHALGSAFERVPTREW